MEFMSLAIWSSYEFHCEVSSGNEPVRRIEDARLLSVQLTKGKIRGTRKTVNQTLSLFRESVDGWKELQLKLPL